MIIIIKHKSNFPTYRSDNVGTKNAISSFVTKDLHQSIGVVVCLGSAVGSEWEFSDFVFNSLIPEVLLAGIQLISQVPLT